MRSQDYDEKIQRAEEQLKKWRSERKRLRSKEVRKAAAEAERARQEELMRCGEEVQAYRDWMQDMTITQDGRTLTVMQWYEQTRRKQQ